MVRIKKQLVSDSVVKQRSYGYGNKKIYITVHQTGNTSPGADAQVHANIQSNLNSRQASWQYSVDDREAIQSFDDDVRCWHASDGRGPGNTQSIAIEICINSDANYAKAVKNGAELVKHLMDKHNIPLSHVKQHHDWYPKNCPAQIRAGKEGINWKRFLDLVQGASIDPMAKGFLQKGDYGDSVKALQQQLYDLGYDLEIDGSFGPETEKVFKQFQKDHKITDDGLYGPDSQATMTKGEYIAKKIEEYDNKRLDIVYHEPVDFYSKATWDKKYVVDAAEKGFSEVLAKYTVGRHDMYEVVGVSGKKYFITAHEKFVKLADKEEPKEEIKEEAPKEPQYKAGEQPKVQKSVRFRTGGLNAENREAVMEYFHGKDWWGEVKVPGEKAPYLVSGYMNAEKQAEFKAWMDERGWWYEVQE